MIDGFYEVGDEVYHPNYVSKERMVVEEVYKRGKVAFYVCSFAEQPWFPQTIAHHELKPWGSR